MWRKWSFRWNFSINYKETFQLGCLKWKWSEKYINYIILIEWYKTIVIFKVWTQLMNT